MRIEVVSIHDTADGGCRILFEMDDDTMYQFMRIGLMSVLRTAALVGGSTTNTEYAHPIVINSFNAGSFVCLDCSVEPVAEHWFDTGRDIVGSEGNSSSWSDGGEVGVSDTVFFDCIFHILIKLLDEGASEVQALVEQREWSLLLRQHSGSPVDLIGEVAGQRRQVLDELRGAVLVAESFQSVGNSGEPKAHPSLRLSFLILFSKRIQRTIHDVVHSADHNRDVLVELFKVEVVHWFTERGVFSNLDVFHQIETPKQTRTVGR